MAESVERIACIDVGTNTALLLIADLDPVMGRITPVAHRQVIVRLGQNVDEQRKIRPEALERLISCLSVYATLCLEFEARRIIAAGTSALRDAANHREVIAAVRLETGIDLHCISGQEEAELTFFGAVAGVDPVPEPFSVIDIGGGSTEIIMGNSRQIERSVSMNIGSVRLTERFGITHPPDREALNSVREDIDQHLARCLPPFFAARQHVFGVAGTLTTIAQVCIGELHFDPAKVQGYRLDYHAVHVLLDRFCRMTLQEIVALGIPEQRADVITVGTLILHQFMRMLGVGSITVSIQGLRFGMAQRELHRLQQKR
jgi:exopolyphosphatase/guanosine-5'-triphosphate,3'-diphosphate pyrophosphatase